MALVRSIQSNFGAGELTPRMRGRYDNPKYVNGAGEETNFIPLLQGGASYRPGMQFRLNCASASGSVEMAEFAPNSTDSFILEATNLQFRVIDAGDGSIEATIVTPYLEADLGGLYFSYDVDVIFITHLEGKYEPRTLTRGTSSWTLATIDFTSHPFGLLDQSDTVLSVTNEESVIKLVSDNGSEFSTLPANLQTTPRYVEYKIGEEYYLGRILDSNTTPATDDPTATVIYVEPVEGVVTKVDQAAKFVYSTDAIDVPSGEHHLRSDTLMFNYDMEDAWIRIISDYPDVRNTAEADGVVRWCKIKEFLGQMDVPTKFIAGAGITNADFELGHIYRLNDVGSGGFAVVTSAPVDTGAAIGNIKWDDGFVYQADGDQFTWDNYASMDNADHGLTSSPAADTQLDDMSSLKSFDVVDVYYNASPTGATATVLVAGTNLIQPTGNITVLDQDTDPDGEAHHTATLTASKAFFASTSAQEIGRFYHIRFSDTWVLFEVSAWASTTSVTVKMYGDIPKVRGSVNYVNNGQSATFRRSVWSPDNWPYTVAFQEERLIFGGCPEAPNYVWLSKTDDNYDFRTIEDDGQRLATSGISVPLRGGTLSRIKWLQPGPTLLVGTENGEWQVRPNTFGEGLSATNIRITEEGGVGSALPSIRIGSSVFFVERNRRSLREMVFDFNIDGFRTRDTNLIADHFFRTDPIVGMTYQQKPNSMIWVWTQSGLLYALTFDSENEFYAWSRHRSYYWDGAGWVLAAVKAAAVAPRNGLSAAEDTLWLTIQRDGVNYIETLGETFTDDGTDNFKPNLNFLDSHTRFPDSGYLSSSITSVTGLTRFAGKRVAVVIDGSERKEVLTVSGAGALTLPVAANKYVLVGNPYTGVLRSMPLVTQGPAGPNYGQRKKMIELSVFLVDSIGFSYGEPGRVTPNPVSFADTVAVMGQSPPLFTGFKSEWKFPNCGYDFDSYFEIQQTQPYPLTVLAAAVDMETSK